MCGQQFEAMAQETNTAFFANQYKTHYALVLYYLNTPTAKSRLNIKAIKRNTAKNKTEEIT